MCFLGREACSASHRWTNNQGREIPPLGGVAGPRTEPEEAGTSCCVAGQESSASPAVPGGWQKGLRASVSRPGQEGLWAPAGLSLGSRVPQDHLGAPVPPPVPRELCARLFVPRTYGVHGQLGGGPGTQQPGPGAQQPQRGPHRRAQCRLRWSALGAQPAGERWGDVSLRLGDTDSSPAPSLHYTPALFLERKEGLGTRL